MGQDFVCKLMKMVEKYPFHKVHEAFAYHACAMLKIRDRSSYMPDSISASDLVKQQALETIRDLGEVAENEFKMEMLDITNEIILFSELSEEGVGHIINYCKEIIYRSTSPKEDKNGI